MKIKQQIRSRSCFAQQNAESKLKRSKVHWAHVRHEYTEALHISIQTLRYFNKTSTSVTLHAQYPPLPRFKIERSWLAVCTSVSATLIASALFNVGWVFETPFVIPPFCVAKKRTEIAFLIYDTQQIRPKLNRDYG